MEKRKSLIFLGHPEQITIFGKATVTVIRGAISTLGHVLKVGDGRQEIYSPESHAFITIATVESSADQQENTFPLDILENESVSKITTSSYSTVFVFEALDSNVCDFVADFTPFRNLFYTKETAGERYVLPGGMGVQILAESECSKKLKFSQDHEVANTHLSKLLETGTNHIHVKKCASFMKCI